MPDETRQPDATTQREFALDVVRQLRVAGYEALWAGGCVRDQLLGCAPKDYDVATSALPDQVREVFGQRRTIPIGAAFGVITVLGPKPAGQIEVATFRSDADYSDGRRPDGVHFTDAEHDASRRDFTINGLFYDPVEDRVIDYVGGQQDLENQLIRGIGDAAARISEDKLRMLRAVRFAAAFGFEIEGETRRAVERHASEITVVSGERIGAEMARMLTHESRSRAVRELREVGLLLPVFPELGGLDDAALEERCEVLERLDSPSLPLALAAAMPTGTRGGVAARVAKRLKYTGDDAKRVAWLLDGLGLMACADTAPWPVVQRMLIHPGAAELVALREAEIGGVDAATTFCREKLALPPETLNPPPLLSGADLIAAGFQPGPEFGTLLEKIRDEQLEGRLRTKQEALALANQA